MPDSPESNEPVAFIPEAVKVMMDEMLPAGPVSRFSALITQEEFRKELNRLFLSEWHWGIPEEVRFRPFKAHKTRCTFEVSGRTGNEWHNVIVKVHAEERSDVFSAMKAVEASGFGPDSKFAIPQPLAYSPSLHVLFEEKIEGTWALEIFMNGSLDEQLETARRCGVWLARFHSAAPSLGGRDKTRELFSATRYYAGHVREFGGTLGSKSDLLMQKVEVAMPAPNGTELCTGHGSYIPEHVFLSGPRTIIIDIDEHDLADPGRDLAWFCLSLQRLGLKKEGSIRAQDAAVEAFLQAYESVRGQDVMKNVRFFKAAECLHRANRDLYKRKIPIPQWADIMLDEGLRTLP